MGVQVQNPPKRGTLAYLEAFPNEVLTMSLEEYWENERRNAYKSTFFQNKVTAIMPYTTENHNRISRRLVVALSDAVEEQGKELFYETRPIWIEQSELNTYPDIYIVEKSEKIVFRGQQVAEMTPSVVIEILSNSTEGFDKGGKLRYYKTIPSLKQIVLVSQNEPVIDMYEKNADGDWIYTDYIGLKEKIKISDIELSLATIYKNVDFSLGIK
jgi:Uma2 family endonuclease